MRCTVGRCSDATDENVRFLHNSLEFSYEDGWWDWTDQLFRVCSLYLIGAPIWNGNWSEILAYLKLAFLFPSRFISFLCVLFFGSATLLPRYFLNNSADGCKCNWSSKWNSFCWFPFCCSCSCSERSECLWRRHFIDPLLSFTLYQESAKNPFESPDRDYPRILRERIPMDSINISFLFFFAEMFSPLSSGIHDSQWISKESSKKNPSKFGSNSRTYIAVESFASEWKESSIKLDYNKKKLIVSS